MWEAGDGPSQELLYRHLLFVNYRVRLGGRGGTPTGRKDGERGHLLDVRICTL